MPFPTSPLSSTQILAFYPNPIFGRPGVPLTIKVSPIFGGNSFTVTAGALPSGLTLNPTTGEISGTVTSVTPNTLVTIQGTNGTGTWPCVLSITITDVPDSASTANQNSATGLTSLVQRAEMNFLSASEYLINQANAQGRFNIYMTLPEYVSFNFVYAYFSKLNFIVKDLSPSQNSFGFQSEFAGYPDFPSPYPYNLDANYPGCSNFSDFTQFPAMVRPKIARRVLISFAPYSGYYSFPYGF